MKLLVLRCPTCAQKLTPQNREVVVMRCANCGTAVSLNDGGLDTVPLLFAAPAVEKFDAWAPLWLFNGRVHIHSRQTQGSNKRARQDAEQLWGYPRQLYVPAWHLPTKAACQLGGDLVQHHPFFQQIEPPAQATVLERLEFVVFNVEAARQDWLKDLQFTSEAAPPQLWAVPAQGAGTSWRLLPRLQ